MRIRSLLRSIESFEAAARALRVFSGVEVSYTRDKSKRRISASETRHVCMAWTSSSDELEMPNRLPTCDAIPDALLLFIPINSERPEAALSSEGLRTATAV